MDQSVPPTSPTKIPLPSPTDTNFDDSEAEDIPETSIEPSIRRLRVPFQIQLARPYGSPRRLPPEILSLIFGFLLASQTIVIRNSQPNVDVLWTSARGANVRVDENDFEGYPLGSTPTRGEIEPSSRPITYNRPSLIQRIRNISALARDDTRNYKRSFLQVVNGNGTRGVWYRAERDVLFFESNSAFHRFIGETNRVTPGLTGQGFEDLVIAHAGIQTVYLLYAVPFIDPRDPDYHPDYFGNPFRYLSTFLDLNRLAITAPDGEMRRKGGNGRVAGQRALILNIMRSYVEESGRTFKPPTIVFVRADSLRDLVNRDVRVEPRFRSTTSPGEGENSSAPAQASADGAPGSREEGLSLTAVQGEGSCMVSGAASNESIADQQQAPVNKEHGQDETPQQTINRLNEENRKLRKEKEQCDKKIKKLRGEFEQEREKAALRALVDSHGALDEQAELRATIESLKQERDTLAAEFEVQKEVAWVYILRVLEESKEDDKRCEAKLEEQREAFAAERERLEQEIQKLQATIQEREQELATSNATCKLDKANLNGRIDVLKQEIVELEEDSENAEKRIEALINSGATIVAKNDTLHGYINKLRAELKDLRDGIALADQERADTREAAQQQVNEAMRRKAEAPFLEVTAGLQEQIKTVEREYQATKAVMAQSQRDAAEAKAKAEKEFADRKAILDDIIISHEAEIVDLREQVRISRATEERQAIQQDLDRRNEELEDLREQMDSTVKQMEERAARAKKDAENASRFTILDLENQYANIKRQFMDRMRDQIAYLNGEIRVVELRIESKKKRAAIKASFGTPFAPGRPRFKVPYAKSAM